MRLAEALILRADCQKRFEQLKQRIVGNAKVQEGDEPAENPDQLIKEMEAVADELLDLIQRINKTNSTTPLQSGKSLSDALADRDVLMLKRTVYSSLAAAASVTQARTSKSEVKFKSTVSVPEIQKLIDSLSKSYRELDGEIQELNWKADLLA
ncbi:hypothetical protein B1R32_10759 [Abditibacterium utsteinense]|uniref:Septicolysin n=1 Tax=Abditibacterium utsteinense TaxID=1960156 RepID=A0A2S8STA2_9BACT|nr:DIP1984 family protein [Abditibacterium utsteinense]PQV64034.1 hypothetical protein B1R32_10759 [Abditibacterium utsteinense]